MIREEIPKTEKILSRRGKGNESEGGKGNESVGGKGNESEGKRGKGETRWKWVGNELDLSKAEEGRKHQFKDRERKGLGEEMVKRKGRE